MYSVNCWPMARVYSWTVWELSASVPNLLPFVTAMTSEETGYALGGDFGTIMTEILAIQYWEK